MKGETRETPFRRRRRNSRVPAEYALQNPVDDFRNRERVASTDVFAEEFVSVALSAYRNFRRAFPPRDVLRHQAITDLGPRLARFLLGEVSHSRGKGDTIGSWLLYNSRAIKSNGNLPLSRFLLFSLRRNVPNGARSLIRGKRQYKRHPRFNPMHLINFSNTSSESFI